MTESAAAAEQKSNKPKDRLGSERLQEFAISDVTCAHHENEKNQNFESNSN